jgi:hypothetical protein
LISSEQQQKKEHDRKKYENLPKRKHNNMRDNRKIGLEEKKERKK